LLVFFGLISAPDYSSLFFFNPKLLVACVYLSLFHFVFCLNHSWLQPTAVGVFLFRSITAAAFNTSPINPTSSNAISAPRASVIASGKKTRDDERRFYA